MKKPICLLLLSWVLSTTAFAQQMPPILPLQERAALEDKLLQERLDSLMPTLMRKQGVDMWLVIAREYNEDPVIRTMLPATWLAARRRTILLFYDNGNTVERLAVARYDIGNLFKGAWNPEQEPDQWKRLATLIAERKPRKIGLNYSTHFGHADGLAKHEWDALMQYLPRAQRKRVASAEKLAVDWLQVRTETELALYEQICQIGHNIIAEGFSEKVIQPGITTTDDVVWWFRERIAELKLEAWFHPTVDVQRANPGAGDSQRSFAERPAQEVIQYGDLVHVDLGITYLKLNTDMQQLAYVLKPGETDAPVYLKQALATGNRLQDILTSHMKPGSTGNEVLKATLEQAKQESIVASIYSHPIGYHGHGAGPAIGMWDKQAGVPGTGDYPLQHNTAYAIELNAKVTLPEWNGKEIRVMLEEQAVLTRAGLRYIDGRQKELLLIPRQDQAGKYLQQ